MKSGARVAAWGVDVSLVAGIQPHPIRHSRRRNELEVFQPDLADLLPFLAAGPFLAGYWPLFALIGWAALPA